MPPLTPPTVRRSVVAAVLLAASLPAGGSAAAAGEDRPAADGRPNVIVVLTDDLGFSDLGCYGSEIDTPTLDRLAAGGLRFSQFSNTAKCHSSRVSLLSGRWCKQAGDVDLTRAVTVPEVLRPAGYFTAMAGKWHLSKNPVDFGFDRYWGHLSGATNYYRGDDTFRLGRDPWAVPDDGFYTTVANVDFAEAFLDEARAAGRPYFLYLAFNAPHAPLQPLEADYQKYLGRYDDGWDAKRDRRLAKQNELNLFGAPVEASARPDHVPAWEDLSPEMRDWEARRMTALAAMIDRVDRELGRLVADLEAHGELENTLIVFLSDNGACPYDRASSGIDKAPHDPAVQWSDSTGWAWARNAPFRFYKQNQYEGGVATPAVVHWPAGLKTEPGAVCHEPAHLVDLLPTIAEAAGATVPATFPGRDLSPLAGTSLMPVLNGGTLGERPPIHFLFSRDRGLRVGRWKLVSFRSKAWELYDLAADRAETTDLAAAHPDRVAEMAALWHEIAAEQLREPSKPVTAAGPPHDNKEWTLYDSPRASTERVRAGRKGGDGRAGRAEPKAPRAGALRVRKQTRLETAGGVLTLTLSGTESGLAVDRLALPAGAAFPLSLAFDLRHDGPGGAPTVGQIFVAEDARTPLPKGAKTEFPARPTGDWASYAVRLPAEKSLAAFRFDPSAAPGVVRVRNLRLLDAAGTTLLTWPRPEPRGE